jgi:hypothetical protein|tara:strand:+ start:77 stop:553 length:477 start_codon:yes stop_codon:yes gene_type:complete
MKVRKPNPIEVAQKLGEELRRKPKEVKTWDDLIDNLKKQRLTPGETYRKLNSDNTRFNWKMIRLTLYVWERVEEDKSGYLKPKIDTVRAVVKTRRFEDFFYGYYPDLKFSEKREIELLNKLITEKPGYAYLVEGYYLYPGSKRLIPQKHLNHVLWPKK